MPSICLAVLLLTSALARAAREGRAGNRSRVATQDVKRDFCDGVEDALVCLTDAMIKDPVAESKACRIYVEEPFCYSSHPFWDCSFDDKAACLCQRSDTCRGVAEVLKAKDGLSLICIPGTDSCTCIGSESCPAPAGFFGDPDAAAAGGSRAKAATPKRALEMPDWQCRNASFEFDNVRVAQWSKKCEDATALPEAEQLEAFKQQGGCQCTHYGQAVTLTLSRGELASLRTHPLMTLADALGDQGSQKTGVLGKEIESAETHIKHGKERVVLKVNKQGSLATDAVEHGGHDHEKLAHGKKATKASSSDADGSSLAAHLQRSSEVEDHCVITDGRPDFDKRAWFVFMVMVMPALVSIFAVFTLRQCCWPVADDVQFVTTDRGGTGDGGGNMSSGRSDSSLDSSAQHGASAEAGTSRWPDQRFLALSVMVMVLLRLNTSMILTTADIIVDHALSQDTGHGAHVARSADEVFQGAASGILLAADPIGGILGVICTARFFLCRPRDTLVYGCALAGLGNLAFWAALRASSVAAMVAARVLSGLAGGAVFLGQVYLGRATSRDLRTTVFGLWETSVGIGLLGGPAITGVLEHSFDIGIGPLGESSALSLSVLSLCLLIVVYAVCPQDSELDAAELKCHHCFPCWCPDEQMNHEKWIMQWMLSGSSLVRQLMRFIWEASSVTILSVHFCLGHAKSGFGVSAVLALTVPAQFAFLRVSSWTADRTLVRMCALAELVGLLIIWRTPDDKMRQVEEDVIQPLTSMGNIAKFLTGSAIFYAGNIFTAAPLTSRAVSRGPREVYLLFYSHIAMFLGIAGGAVLSRIFTTEDPHQNTVVVVLLPVVVVQVVLAELSLSPVRERHRETDLQESK